MRAYTRSAPRYENQTLAYPGYRIESAISSLTCAAGLTVVVVLLSSPEFAAEAHIGNNPIIVMPFQDLSDANGPSASSMAWNKLAAIAGIMLILIAVAALIRRFARPALLVER